MTMECMFQNICEIVKQARSFKNRKARSVHKPWVDIDSEQSYIKELYDKGFEEWRDGLEPENEIQASELRRLYDNIGLGSRSDQGLALSTPH